MIHTLEIDCESEPQGLRKLFRKKLMTGGAVVRLKADLSPDEREQIFQTFAPDAKEHSLDAMVLTELAKSCGVEDGLYPKLEETRLVSVTRALLRNNQSSNSEC